MCGVYRSRCFRMSTRVLAITTAVFIMEVLSKLLVQLNFIKNSTPWYLLRLQLYFNMVFLRIPFRYSISLRLCY